MKIKTRLQIAILGGSTLLLATLGLFVDRIMESTLEEQMRKQMDEQAILARSLCDLSFLERQDKLSHDVLQFLELGKQAHSDPGTAQPHARHEPERPEPRGASCLRPPGGWLASARQQRPRRTRQGDDGRRRHDLPGRGGRDGASEHPPCARRTAAEPWARSFPPAPPSSRRITAGESFSGRAVVAGQDYLTSYVPLHGPAGNVAARALRRDPDRRQEPAPQRTPVAHGRKDRVHLRPRHEGSLPTPSHEGRQRHVVGRHSSRKS